MRLKKGDKFGLGKQGYDKVDLYCSVNDVHEDSTYRCFVINGHWWFDLDTTAHTLTINDSEVIPGANVLYRGPWPKDIARDDYNEMIYFMNQQIENRGLLVKAYAWSCQFVPNSIPKTWTRLSNACAAFKKSWQQSSPTAKRAIDTDDFDDAIPF